MRFNFLSNSYILDINSFYSFYSFFLFFFIYSIMTGKTHTIGTRAQVWHGTAKKTSGGLTKSDLMMNKAGRIVSKSKHFSAKKEKRLLKHGYGTQKGKFGFVKVGSRKHRKGSKKMRGGMMPILSPAQANWEGEGIAGAGITQGQNGGPGGPLTSALTGGKRRSRRMYGGSGMAPLSNFGSANWNGDGIDGQGITLGDSGSANLQVLAGMAGGKRRRHRGRGRSMMGGTTSPMPLGMNNPQVQASMYGGTTQQMPMGMNSPQGRAMASS
jgi:hypothetical protein